jgi:sugar lactone lactonase YvrE
MHLIVPMTAVLMATMIGACASPERPPCTSDDEVPTLCGFRNPEDLEHVATAGVVLVSNMRHDGPNPGGGYLSAMVPGGWVPRTLWGLAGPSSSDPQPDIGDPTCTTAPEPDSFYPYGLSSIDVDDRQLVYVAAHAGDAGGREAIEIFELGGSGDGAELTWKACIPSDAQVQINDVAVSSDGMLLASNYMPDPSILRHSLRSTIFRQPTGDVMTWTKQDGWTHLDDTEALMANGVALSKDGQTLFYVESVGAKLHRRSVSDARGAIHIDIEGAPDNLSWTSRGTLLIATHTEGAKMLGCFFRAGACRSAWSVYEITPETMAARRVLTHTGELIGAVATALETDGELLLSSVFDDRIGKVPQSGTENSKDD